MKRPVIALALAALMLASSVLAIALRPTQMLADTRPPLDLEKAVPLAFADWRVDDSIPVVLPSPETQAALNKIYNQVLARTYINRQGLRIMLSIAYGGDQSDAMQVHMPAGCYSGQGFSIKEKSKVNLQTTFGTLPVSRLVAYQGQRNEPITYWMVIGDEIAQSPWDMKLVKMRYALEGVIPEGMLVRISNITPDTPGGYAIQQQFAEALSAALTTENRVRLFGHTR